MEKHILLTGMPGVGKTTLIKKIVEKLSASNLKCSGFYTEELLDNSYIRIGFDLVTFDNKRAKLARTMAHNTRCKYSLGNYEIFVKEFETLAIQAMNQTNSDILVLDEIGKMELFSQQFKQDVDKLFSESKPTILATIPVPKNIPIPLVEKLRNSKQCLVYTVDKSNRNHLLKEIVNNLLKIKEKN